MLKAQARNEYATNGQRLEATCTEAAESPLTSSSVEKRLRRPYVDAVGTEWHSCALQIFACLQLIASAHDRPKEEDAVTRDSQSFSCRYLRWHTVGCRRGTRQCEREAWVREGSSLRQQPVCVVAHRD